MSRARGASVAAALALALTHATPGRAGRAADAIAIVGATVYVTPTERLDGAIVVVRGGVVAAVAASAPVPDGARVIDGRGAIVTAGLVDGDSRLGLTEVALVPDTVEGAFDVGVHAAYRALDGYDPRSVGVPIARGGGVTSVVATPSGGAIAGQSAWIALGDGEVDELAIAAPAALHAGLRAIGGRGAALEALRALIDDARFLARRRAAFDGGQSRELGAGRRDLEAIGLVATRRLPLVVEADRAADVAAVLRLGDELGVRVAIRGGAEAWRVADRLSRAGAAVLLDPTANLPSSFDRRWVRDDGAARLRAAGVEVVITSGGESTGVRTLRQACGLAVRAGMSWSDALAAVTVAPARLFGGGRRRGTLERGEPADLVVWSGDPFELSSRPLHVLVAGVETSLESHQRALLRRYRALPGAAATSPRR